MKKILLLNFALILTLLVHAQTVVPEKIKGNWFRSDNAQWEISIMDSVAIFKSQVWKYFNCVEKNGTVTIGLLNRSKNITLYARVKEGKLLMGDAPANLTKFTAEPDESVKPVDQEIFKLPILRNDTAVYSGYIKNFNKQSSQRTGIVYVNNVLWGNQVPFQFNISDNGYFSIKIPHTNPQLVIVHHPFGTETVFIEPGKELFHFIDPGNNSPVSLFMGDNARVNSDLNMIKNIYTSVANEMTEKILNLTPQQYRVEYEKNLDNDLLKLQESGKKNRICSKANMLWGMALKYRMAIQLLSYERLYLSEYGKKNKNSNNKVELPAIAPAPDKSYYSFLTKEFLEDPFGIMVSEYYLFINRLKSLDKLSPNLRGAPSLSEMAIAMEKSGVKFTDQENEVIKGLAEFDTPEVKKLQGDFLDNYSKINTEFMRKYSSKLQTLYKGKDGTGVIPSLEAEADFLKDQGIELTEDEKSWIAAKKEFDNNPLIQKKSKFQAEHGTQIRKFYYDHSLVFSKILNETVARNRKEQYYMLLGIQDGLVKDIMTSQDFCTLIQKDKNSVTEEDMKASQAKISTPFIANYIKIKNDEAKTKLEKQALKIGEKTGFAITDVAKTPGEIVFESILSKYKNKVVFLDFWATWCGPCISGIEQMKPLKEELAKENIVFVYITNPSSPKEKYDKMIPGIKGDHYRLSEDEWNLLSYEFKISGIPHYMLVGKAGNVINPHVTGMGNEQLKYLLMKYINE